MTQLLKETFAKHGYVADSSILTALHLVQILQRPLLIEGPAGVGKTEIAKVLAAALDTKLIRLQCYEGLDVNQAIYEWNYAKQMIYIRLAEATDASIEEKEANIFSEAFLLKRPLLEAFMEEAAPPVLLIDEIDRADEAFEAYLLEALAEYQITIPELGTIRAHHKPYVILTSNRTRELSDALKRRCLYQWIDYPSFEKEREILKLRVPHLQQDLAKKIAQVMERLRELPLRKIPGIAESLDWARALVALDKQEIDPATFEATLGCIVKSNEDWQRVKEELTHLRL